MFALLGSKTIDPIAFEGIALAPVPFDGVHVGVAARAFVVFLGATIVDRARFRFPTPTPIESPLGCFERVSSMEHPEVAEGWFCVTSGRGCFHRDERHC